MPSAGDKARASDILTRRGVRLRRVANQSVTASTLTSISWDTEDQDTDGFIAVTAATITIPTGLGGLYAIASRVTGLVTGTNRTFSDLTITSSITGMPAQFRQDLDPQEDMNTLTAVIPLNAADTFTLDVFHSEAAAVNFTAWLVCYRVGL